jgi:hypothetical protein
MSTILPVFPAVVDRTDSITLDGIKVRYRLRWSGRASAWYLWLYQPDGTVISDAHPVRPGATVTWDKAIAGHPPGVFEAVGGGDGTDRYDLGGRVQIQYTSDSEVAS